jgi:hypothetical protein
MRLLRVPIVVTVVLMAAGCTTTADLRGVPGGMEPSASATPRSDPPFEPDLVVDREFPDDDGTPVRCTVFTSAVLDSATAGEDAQQRLDAAKAHLAHPTVDWSTVDVDLDDMPADEQASRRDQGVTSPQLYTMVLSTMIAVDFDAAIGLGSGVSRQSYVRCAH